MRKSGVLLCSDIVMREAGNAYGRGQDHEAEALRTAARKLQNLARAIYPQP